MVMHSIESTDTPTQQPESVQNDEKTVPKEITFVIGESGTIYENERIPDTDLGYVDHLKP